MSHLQKYCLALLASLMCCAVNAQTNAPKPDAQVSAAYLDQSIDKIASLQESLDGKTRKLLDRFQKIEMKFQRKLARKDSAKAAEMLRNSQQAYQSVTEKLKRAGEGDLPYLPSLDTLGTSLNFLRSNPEFLRIAKDAPKKLDEANAKVKALQSSFQKSEEIKKFLQERKAYLRQRVDGLGLSKNLKAVNKEIYYYSVQVNEYKQLLKDHKKAEKNALALLSKSELYQNFMRKNSMLASLFRMPDDGTGTAAAANLAGLQTRSQVNNLIQQQISSGGPNAQAQFSQNMQAAQSHLNNIKNKFSNLGGNGELEMPEGFKPNSQKTKSFLQRIELGASIQSQKANGYFPVTSDLALTAGYKINDNSLIGIGAGYKMGWGKNIQHVRITHEGVSLRSFVDIRLKKSFWLTGGYEMNYREAFNRIAELRDRSAWLESGLIGLSKVVDMRSKLLKKTKVQLLWDFLSYLQHSKPAPILFRIGYSF